MQSTSLCCIFVMLYFHLYLRLLSEHKHVPLYDFICLDLHYGCLAYFMYCSLYVIVFPCLYQCKIYYHRVNTHCSKIIIILKVISYLQDFRMKFCENFFCHLSHACYILFSYSYSCCLYQPTLF
jgi:hypothetical protein